MYVSMLKLQCTCTCCLVTLVYTVHMPASLVTCMFILLHVYTCMFILHVCSYYMLWTSLLYVVYTYTCSILVSSFRVIFCLTLILVNPFLSVCHSAARGQTITQRLKTYTPSKRVSGYITSTRDTPLCTRVSEHSSEHAFSGSEHSIEPDIRVKLHKAFSDHLLYSTPAALAVGCSQQLLIIKGRV